MVWRIEVEKWKDGFCISGIVTIAPPRYLYVVPAVLCHPSWSDGIRASVHVRRACQNPLSLPLLASISQKSLCPHCLPLAFPTTSIRRKPYLTVCLCYLISALCLPGPVTCVMSAFTHLFSKVPFTFHLVSIPPWRVYSPAPLHPREQSFYPSALPFPSIHGFHVRSFSTQGLPALVSAPRIYLRRIMHQLW